MKRKSDLWEAGIWILGALPLAITACFYYKLPQQVPLHWGVGGEINAYGPRSQLLWIGALALGLTAMMKILPWFDPKRRNYAKFAKGYQAMRVVMALFMLGMQGVLLYSAFAPGALPVDRLTAGGLGLIFCALGNFMPKFRHNYFCGIKTPWALADEENWRLTHRMAGPLWFGGGLAIFLAALVLPSAFVAAVSGIIVAAVALAPMGYSWWIWHRGHKQ